MTLFDNSLYIEANTNRLKNLFKYVNPQKIQNKRILELGCGNSDLGEVLNILGAKVVSLDGRIENIKSVTEKYPNRECYVSNLNIDDLKSYGKFNIVFSFGLLYHTKMPIEILSKCRNIADILFLETVSFDSNECICAFMSESDLVDQSLDGIGCRPSPLWLETAMHNVGYSSIIDISSSTANWRSSKFDWEIQKTNTDQRDGLLLRKMYVACANDELLHEYISF